MDSIQARKGNRKGADPYLGMSKENMPPKWNKTPAKKQMTLTSFFKPSATKSPATPKVSDKAIDPPTVPQKHHIEVVEEEDIIVQPRSKQV